MTDEVEHFHESAANVVKFIFEAGEVSLGNFSKDQFRKALLLASASHFEKLLTTAVIDFSKNVSGGNEMLASLVRNRVVNRSYHQWFSWEARNANAFYSMFGDDFKLFFEEKHKVDPNFRGSVLAFLEVGRERNKLVHENYVSFSFQKTLDEVIELHRTASQFVVEVRSRLNCT